MRHRFKHLLVVCLSPLLAGLAHALPQLPRLLIDKPQTTVSGLSSGGYMANQLGIAYSATFKGVGIFAAGPYMCAGHSDYTACMYNATISTAMLNTMQADINNWSGTLIDDKANIAAQKVFMFVGNNDSTVGPNPMNGLQTQYLNNGVPSANLEYVKRASTAHVFPTDFDSTGNNSCNSSSSPFVSNCGYDGAKAALSKFYGTLIARNNSPAPGNYLQFDQAAFTGNPGMSGSGWAYVPTNCAAGSQCKLHVVLHGCQQNHNMIGDRFVKNTGYSRWADTNGIVLLFPQTKADAVSRSTAASGSLPNPNGCWDWIGWYGSTFARKAGTQMAALKAMVDHLSSGTGASGGSLPAPTGAATSNASSSALTVSWNGVGGAVGYNLYRAGAKINSSLVTGGSFTETGLTPGTTYGWTIGAVDAGGAEGTRSAPVAGSTTGTAPSCTHVSNYDHTMAGRAYALYGYAYAYGSNQYMGLWNIYVMNTLKQTSPGYYVVGSC
jgi:hypothetical protein